MSLMQHCLNGLRGKLTGLTHLRTSYEILRCRPTVGVLDQSAALSSCSFQRHGWMVDYSNTRPYLYSDSGQPWSLTQKRFHWRPKLIRHPSTKPLSFDFSGDQSMSLGPLNLHDPKLGFENVEELKDVDESVKKIFSLEFDTNSGVIRKLVHDLLEKVKDHPFDLQSLEVKIAGDTVRIRNEIRHCLRFRNDKISKARLIKRIVRRRRMLEVLKSQDIEKFNWILSELKIKYSDPQKYDKQKKHPSKKALRKKIARDAALALQKQKMEVFRKRLEQERVAFEKYKETEMSRIEAQLKELGIGEMTTLKETLQALDQEDLLPKPEPWKSRRRLLLEKKFVLYGERKKVLDEQILKVNGFLTAKEMPYMP